MGDPATPLDNAGNWDAVSSLAGCVNSSFLCGIDVVNIPGETVLPSEQAIIDQIKAAYVPSTPFTHGQVVDIKNALNVKVAEATVYRIN